MFNEDEAYSLANLVMDSTDGTPEYDALIKKLLANRDSAQEYTESEKRLIIAAIEEYMRDTEEYITPSYDSSPFSSFAISQIRREREMFCDLRKRILQSLSEHQSES